MKLFSEAHIERLLNSSVPFSKSTEATLASLNEQEKSICLIGRLSVIYSRFMGTLKHRNVNVISDLLCIQNSNWTFSVQYRLSFTSYRCSLWYCNLDHFAHARAVPNCACAYNTAPSLITWCDGTRTRAHAHANSSTLYLHTTAPTTPYAGKSLFWSKKLHELAYWLSKWPLQSFSWHFKRYYVVDGNVDEG